MFQQQFVDTLSATADSLTPVMQEQAAQMVQELSVWDLTMRGGFIMIPLAILSIISIYIFVERCIAISRARKEDSSFMQRIRDYIHDGEIESARNLCHRTDTPWLATTAAGGPMIGFLGTVIGMVDAFYNLASAGTSANIAVLADGIYAALVTTVAGLIVGIIALFAYNYLVARINKVMNNLEAKTMEFMDLLNEPA